MLIKPLEALLIDDPQLDGRHGLNRAPANPSEPVVDSDIAAAKLFLATHAATPTTQRNYTKEIERLILWSINVKGKPFSSLSFSDLQEFIDFLANPVPIETWCAERKFPRDSADWKPFVYSVIPPKKSGEKSTLVAGVATSSRLTAMAILGSFFTWLCDYGYLMKNPMRQLKTKRKAVRAEKPKLNQEKVERFLDEEMWAAFQEAIEALPKSTQNEVASYERAVFIAALMLFLAPRASELANSTMNSFRSDGEFWWWHVVGKGSKAEKIPVVEDMLNSLIRYRNFLNLTPLPLNNDDTPLLRSLRTGAKISARQLNYILDDLFESAAQILEQKALLLPESAVLAKAEFNTRASKIRKASSHWGRHTSITFQVRSGVPKDIVQKTARHSDARTTERYTHEDQKRWHNEAQKLRS